jgi:hypothetical protein
MPDPIAEEFVLNYLSDCEPMDEVIKSIQLILNYKQTDFYERKNSLIAEWRIDSDIAYKFIIAVFTMCLTNKNLTYQAIVGAVQGRIKHPDEISRVEIAADLIGLISSTGLIYIYSQRGEYHIIGTEYNFPEVIPMMKKHKAISRRPQPVESNWVKDYFIGSMILGHSMNHHNDNIRLSHLNRMNQIAFTVNADFIDAYEEGPTKAFVTTEQERQWEVFKEESSAQYEAFKGPDKRFFIQHKYDSRGRCYSGSYYLNPQGSSFKKAAIQLQQEEIVEGF